MSNQLDSYTLRARYFPVVLLVLPLAVAIVRWLPTESIPWRIVLALGVSSPVVVLLSHFGRDLGKRKQAVLFKNWGGPPAVRMLRHRDTTLSEATRDRYHATLSKIVPNIELPSARSERAKPEAADAAYLSCTDFLRERTRDRTRFKLLFEENVAYGFRRNLWAMKPAGITFSAMALLLAGWGWFRDHQSGTAPDPITLAATVVASAMLAWWLLRIRESWVKVTADAYSERLLGACDELDRDAPAAK